ncbi:hypothetical protein [Vagococcus acidifermentans]|nr:hypothetical protein [Vagococcus acidifermentans]
MTLYKKDAFDRIIGELRRRNIPIQHIQLEQQNDEISSLKGEI